MKKGIFVFIFIVFSIVSACILGGCANPCEELRDRVCADLGQDCAVFTNDTSIYKSVMPTSRYIRKSELGQCEMFLSDTNYRTYTLPSVKYRIALKRDPNTPVLNLPSPVPVDGFFSGFSSWFLYLLGPAAVAFIFFYTRKSMKRPS